MPYADPEKQRQYMRAWQRTRRKSRKEQLRQRVALVRDEVSRIRNPHDLPRVLRRVVDVLSSIIA